MIVAFDNISINTKKIGPAKQSLLKETPQFNA